MQESCCLLKEEIVSLTCCGKVFKLQPFLLLLWHSRVHRAAAVRDAEFTAVKSTAKACCYSRSLLSESLSYFRAPHYSWIQLTLVCALESVWETGQGVLEHKVTVWLHCRYSIEWRLWWQGTAPNLRWTKHSYSHCAWKAQFWLIPPSQTEPLFRRIKGKGLNYIWDLRGSQ